MSLDIIERTNGSKERETMTKYDRISSVFWILFGAAISTASIRLGPGSLSTPGPGLIPLGCGLVLFVLGSTLFLFTFQARPGEKEAFWKEGTLWKKLILTLGSLVCYAFLLDVVGFLPITFLFLMFVCRVGGLGWKKTVVTAVVVTVCCYILFNYLLGIRFPRGFLG
jgi:hypothetical protein